MGIGFDPCGDRQTQVGLMSYLGCLHFVHKKYNGINRYLARDWNSCAPDARTHHGLSMVDSEEKLEAVKEFCHLRDMRSAEGSCELTVPTLQVCLGVSLAISTTSHQPSTALLVLTLSDIYSELYFEPGHEKTCFLHISIFSQ